MKHIRSIAALLLISLVGCLAPNARAAVVAAPTCSLADVQGAINSAAEGDTVTFPAGACAWNGIVSMPKGIDVLGAGKGQSLITSPRFNVTSKTKWSVGGFTSTASTAGFNITGGGNDWRVHDVDFTGVTGFTQNRIIWISDCSRGVVDHNIFAKPRSIQVHIRESNCANGNGSWMRPLDPGGPDAVYIEDNTFSQDPANYNVSTPATDCDGGGRMVIRHNRFRSTYTEMHDSIISGLRGCRKWEIYSNDWDTPQTELNQTGQYAQIAIRGGWGAVFDNNFKGDSSGGFTLIFSNYRTGGQTAGNPWTSTTQNSGNQRLNVSPTSSPSLCSIASAMCVKLDGPGGAGLPANYPSRDQMGTDGGGDQAVVPALFWNNKVNGKLFNPLQEDYSDRSYLKADRDYCFGATKPTTCAGKPVTYQPYVYPHPVVSGAPVPPPAPVDCAVTWGEWTSGAWNACDATTLTQSRTETRIATVTQQPANGGKACPALTEMRTSSQPCTVPCPDPKPSDELRAVACPVGTVGQWSQERSYSCTAQGKWVAGEWVPFSSPPGACPTETKPPKVTVTTTIESADCTQEDPNRLHYTCRTQTGVDVVVEQP